jgi:hypothetical protein
VGLPGSKSAVERVVRHGSGEPQGLDRGWVRAEGAEGANSPFRQAPPSRYARTPKNVRKGKFTGKDNDATRSPRERAPQSPDAINLAGLGRGAATECSAPEAPTRHR